MLPAIKIFKSSAINFKAPLLPGNQTQQKNYNFTPRLFPLINNKFKNLREGKILK